MLSNPLSLISRRVMFETKGHKGSTSIVAAITKEGLTSFLKFMVYAAYLMEVEQPTAPMLAKYKEWGEEAKEFAKEFKVSPKLIDKAITSVPSKWTDKNRSKFYDDVWVLRDIAHDNKAKIKGTRGISATLISLMNALDTYYNSGSETSYKNAERWVSQLGEPSLTQLMNKTVDEEADPKHIHNYLNWVRNHLKDPKAKSLPTEEKNKLKGAQLEKYNEMNKKKLAAEKAVRRKIVRDHGEKLMPINAYHKAMKALNLDSSHIGQGFDGKIDEEGKYYTKGGIQIEGLPTGGKVTMNPDFHPTKNPSAWVAKGIPAVSTTGKEVPYYTEHHKRFGREDKKADDMKSMAEWLPKMQTKWRKDLKSKGLDQVLAMMVECLYLTSARAGTNVNAKSSGGNTYGLATWQVKHIRPQNNGNLKIVYRPGKSKVGKAHVDTVTDAKVSITHVVKPDGSPEAKALIDYLVKATNGKPPSAPVWQYNNKPVTYGQLNGYLKELSDGNVSPKNFRTFRGTKLFLDLLEAKPPKKNISEKELKAYYEKITGQVGEILGHVKTNTAGERETTSKTAQNSYIAPKAQIDLFRDRGFQPPSNIHKFEKSE